MDYTTVPRSLIYRDRRSLEEFGVYGDHKINIEIAKALRSFPIINERNAESKALTCMNNAYYICTMALLEKDPVWRISDYETISDTVNNTRWKIEIRKITISLVYLYLCCLPDDVGTHLMDFLQELNRKVSTYGYFEHILENIDEDVELPPNEFAPRIIDMEAVQDALAVEGFSWVKFVNYFEERSVRDIVEAFGKTEDEKHNVVDLLRQVSHGFYTAGFNDYPEKVDKLLDNIDKEISFDFNPGDERKIKEEDKAELIIPIDPEPYEARIKELESEIEKLKSENKELKEQQPPTDNNDEIEELKEEIAYLKNETGKLSSREAAILTITACYHAGGLPSNRKNLYPILTNLFGVGETLAKRRLKEGINEEGAEALAKCFDGVSPVVARTLREMPEKLKNKKKK